MVDFLGVKSHLETNNLSFYTFYPKSEKPIKAVIRHLPINTPAEDIYDGLVSLGFDVVSEEPEVTNLPLFLITLPRSAKSQEIFRLPSLCHIAIKVEAYKTQSALMQCHNCQQFGHVWANCKQPPHCLWCRGGHLHKECPEKENAASTPACCNCKLLEGEKPHHANYQGGTRGRSCRRGNRRKHPELQPEGCSLTLLLLVSPLLRHSKAVQCRQSKLGQGNFLW
jgi:hypothetical protein